MLSGGHAERVASRFGLGRGAVISGPMARGELGQVWRIDTSAGDFSMAIAQIGHLGELACRRWLDPTQDRARSAARVEEFLGEPITRPLIHDLLEAAPR